MTESPRPQLPLHVVGANVLRILRLAHEHLQSLQLRGRVGMACANVGLAADELERALDADVDSSKRELREVGPHLGRMFAIAM